MKEENIKRYLNNEMTEGERFLFEQEMERDNALKEEVNFQQEMFAFFGQRKATNDLKIAIEESADTYFNGNNKTKKKFPYIYLWGILSVLVLVGIVFLVNRNTTPSTSSAPVTEENDVNENESQAPPIITTPTTTEETETSAPIDLSPIQTPKESVPTRPDSQKEDTKRQEDRQPIADASIDRFVPNSTFESILEGGVRANNTFEVTAPQSEQVFKLDNEEILWTISANTDITTPISIAIYDNNPSSFDNDLKILSQELTPKEIEDDQFMVNWSAKIPFQKGLYYYVIRDVETNEILYTNKFFVR